MFLYIFIFATSVSQMIGTNLDVRKMVHGKPSQKSSIDGVFNWSLVEPNNNQNNMQGPNIKTAAIQTQPLLKKEKKIDEVVQEYFNKHTKKLKPHQIKNQLYVYDDIHLKRCHSQSRIPKNESLQKKAKVKLNLNDEKDRQVIESRKQKIKQFSRCTRDLPNSAFATYYGKPPFESYGRCNSNFNLKTHNVMPHRGRNNPNIKQTYQSALKKAKNTKISEHIPRKPIQQTENFQKRNEQNQKPSRLPLQKPDLINHVRFSEAKTTTDRKDPVPVYQQLKAQMRKRRQQIKKKEEKKKKKAKKGSLTTLDQQDGLKFMNTREGLLNIIENKRIKDSRLAYKVTECYPKQAEQLNSKRHTEDDQQWFKPAGLTSKKSEPACNIIYRRYEN